MEKHMKVLFAGLGRLSSGFIVIVFGASAFALVPQPAADQSEPIAIVGAIIHIGNGEVIADGVITFSEGIITAVAAVDDGIDLSNHLVIDLQVTHVYPGFVLPNTRSEEHTSELQSRFDLVCRLLLEKINRMKNC